MNEKKTWKKAIALAMRNTHNGNDRDGCHQGLWAHVRCSIRHRNMGAHICAVSIWNARCCTQFILHFFLSFDHLPLFATFTFSNSGWRRIFSDLKFFPTISKTITIPRRCRTAITVVRNYFIPIRVITFIDAATDDNTTLKQMNCAPAKNMNDVVDTCVSTHAKQGNIVNWTSRCRCVWRETCERFCQFRNILFQLNLMATDHVLKEKRTNNFERTTNIVFSSREITRFGRFWN